MITSDRDLSGINCIDDTVCRNDPGSGLCIETATFGFLASIYRAMNLSTFVLFELLLGIRFSNAIPVGPLEEQDVEVGRSTLSLLSVLSVFIVCCVAVLYYNWLRNPFTSLRRRAFSFHLGGHFSFTAITCSSCLSTTNAACCCRDEPPQILFCAFLDESLILVFHFYASEIPPVIYIFHQHTNRIQLGCSCL
ncbi:hypothetical protein Agabi119p4_7228 [Agaricus bisporus var. burnettii]|uniref:Uncharacterized protein n=1 Tax=Agaricus bisporus var. burnettii TaxID=192524 RepID=A0A8H7C7R8_AGABI|nr:hypothetical protein Agabi119p4_7228 [Agaricus bisporus var. burnettii]